MIENEYDDDTIYYAVNVYLIDGEARQCPYAWFTGKELNEKEQKRREEYGNK